MTHKIISSLVYLTITPSMLQSLVPAPTKNVNKIVYRQINKINHDLLYNDLTEIVFDFNETDIDTAVISYNSILHFLLDKHAPEKCKSFAIREEREWMTDEVQTVKRQKRKSERIWRTSKLVVHRLIYKEYCIQLNVAITYAKNIILS